MKPATHPSLLALDEYALGAMPESEAALVEGHVASCSRCRGELERSRNDRQQFAGHFAPDERLEVPRAAPRPNRLRAFAWGVLPVAAAAALVLSLRPADEPAYGVKGAPHQGAPLSARLLAHRPGGTVPLTDGLLLAQGDRLDIQIEAGAREILIVSVDGAGALSVYFPAGGTRSARVEAPQGRLPHAIELDDAPGPERLFVLASEGALSLESIAPQLRAIAEGGAEAIRASSALTLPSGVEQRSVCFEKERR